MDARLRSILTSAFDWVSGQLYAPVALTRWKNSMSQLEKEAGFVRDLDWAF